MREYIEYMKKKQLFTVVVEEDEAGYYAYCPQLQGCRTQGETYEEALKNIKEAIELHVEDRIKDGESWEQLRSVKVTSLGLSV